MSDLQSCIDQLRSRPSCVALQALYDLILYAGDKSCKSKNREYMGELRAEQARRVRTVEFAFDDKAKLLISVRAVLSFRDSKKADRNIPGNMPYHINIFCCSDE